MDTPARRVWFGIAPPTPQELDRITPQEPSPEPPTGDPRLPPPLGLGQGARRCRRPAAREHRVDDARGVRHHPVPGPGRTRDLSPATPRHPDTFDPHEVGLALMELGWELAQESPDSF